MDTTIVSHARVAELAARRFRDHAYAALKSITCEYAEGILFLRGRVQSYFLKQLAQEAVSSLEGVEAIQNQIEVA